MIRSIMVPIDGSDFSCQSIPLAISVARTTGAALKLVQVHIPMYPMMSMDGVAPLDLQFDREVEQQETEYLATLAMTMSEQSGLPIGHAVVTGDVVPALVQYAHDNGTDLVVMTTHGRSGFSRGWLGSVADELIREIHVPVLLSRGGRAGAQLHAAHPFDHILVPLDGSALAESILPSALGLGGRETLFTLLRIREPADVIGFGYYAAAVISDEESEAAATQRALDYLDRLATPLREDGARIHTTVRSGVNPSSDIVECAHQYDVDLIALSTHGRHGLSRIALGSVADKILRSFAGCVLVYRPLKLPAENASAEAHLHADARPERGQNAGVS